MFFYLTNSYYERTKELKEKEEEAEVEEEAEMVKVGRSRSPAFDFTEAWFRKFTMNTDSQPNSDVKHLPACLTKSAVFNIYKEEISGGKRPTLAKSTFIYNMWKKHFPHDML